VYAPRVAAVIVDHRQQHPFRHRASPAPVSA
jgi:hypothetical protein